MTKHAHLLLTQKLTLQLRLTLKIHYAAQPRFKFMVIPQPQSQASTLSHHTCTLTIKFLNRLHLTQPSPNIKMFQAREFERYANPDCKQKGWGQQCRTHQPHSQDTSLTVWCSQGWPSISSKCGSPSTCVTVTVSRGKHHSPFGICFFTATVLGFVFFLNI